MIHKTPPPDFISKSDIVSCLCEFQDRILLLRRVKDDDTQAGKWGAPGGKKESGENLFEAMVREISEETGLSQKDLNPAFIRTLYVRYPNFDFTYHMFKLKFNQEFVPTLQINEHSEFKWLTPAEALKLDLILDMDACIHMEYFQN